MVLKYFNLYNNSTYKVLIILPYTCIILPYTCIILLQYYYNTVIYNILQYYYSTSNIQYTIVRYSSKGIGECETVSPPLTLSPAVLLSDTRWEVFPSSKIPASAQLVL